jgi:choline dehydrogenase-like flavoprotein
MAERVDVCIVGSGFGGSISAYRLAELYRAAGQSPSVLVLERGRRHQHTDFRQSADLEHLSSIYGLVQGQGAQIVVGDGVGGGSNFYLAASLRAPRETFERRDRHPDDGPPRRVWPSQLSRASLNPYYTRVEAALRVQRPTWKQVAKAGGLWAKTLDHAGHTCDRVPLAIDLDRCIQARWCHTGCIYGAKNSVITNYLASAERMGVTVRPNSQAELIVQSAARPYRYLLTVSEIDNDGDDPTRQPTGRETQIECKVLILSAGAMGNAPLLMRSRPGLPSLSAQTGKHLGINGDHIAAVEYDETKVRDVLGLPGYGQIYKGNHISTMTYDFWTNNPGNAGDGKRFTLQEIYLSPLAHTLYDDGRDPAGAPSFFGLQKKQALSTFNNHIEVLAMVEDTHDGEFIAPPPFGSHVRPNAGPLGVGPFNYELSEQSVRVREAADDAIRSVVERNGLGRFMKMTFRGAFASHPLGGCRMAESNDEGVVDHRNEVFGYEGLFCIDSSAIPTSLGVNPSLTISAVSERAAALLVDRAADYGLPAKPAGFAPGVPGVFLGPHTTPVRRSSDDAIDAKVRSYA